MRKGTVFLPLGFDFSSIVKEILCGS